MEPTFPDLIHSIVETDTWSFCITILSAVFFSSFIRGFLRDWNNERKAKELEKWVNE